MYLRVFIGIFELQMYTLGHTPYQFFCGYLMLWIRVEGFSSGMDVCDISSFLTLTLCALVGFWHGIDALDWGIAPSLHLWSRLWVVLEGHTPFLSIFLVGLFMFCLLAFSDLTLGHTPFDPSCFGFSSIVPGFDPSCLGFFGIMPGFDPFCFGFSGIASGFDPFCFGFSRIVPGFDPSCFRFSSIVPEFDPSCFGFSDFAARFDPSYFGFSGIVPGFNPFCFEFFGIASGFDPFCFGFSGVMPRFNPVVLGSLVLTRIRSLISRSLWYLPGYDSFFGTCPDFYLLFGTRPDPTLFQYSPGSYSFPVLARILHFFSTCPDMIPFPVLARIPHFSETRPDSTFLILTRIWPIFWYSPWFVLLYFVFFDTRLDMILHFDFSGTCPGLFPVLYQIRFPILSDIAFGSPLLSLVACWDLLCFSGIVPGSLIFSCIASDFLLSSLASCPDSFSFLRQCAWVL